MDSLHTWALDQLSIFLGLDPETLETQVMPHLMSFDSPDALSEHLHSMLGTSNDTIDFIETFVKRRFPPMSTSDQSKQSASPLRRSQQAPKNAPQEQQHVFPSLPAVAPSTQWPGNFNIKPMKTKNTTSQQGGDRAEKSKKKIMTFESALKELDINTTTSDERKACPCQATKHPLLTVAPNCLHCGKIICTAEGVGPCTFCGTPVMSKEQQQTLIAEAKKKRSEKKRVQNEVSQQRRAKATPTSSVRYASKVSGDVLRDYTYDVGVEEERLHRAEEHKEKLLEFQRTSAKRSTVIDQASDFMTPTDQSNQWLSPQERALELKKQQANLKRLVPDPSSRRRVLTIDLQSKQVLVEDKQISSESEDEELILPDKTPVPSQGGSAGTFANNPLLKGIQAPQFRGKKKSESKGRSRRKERVQYEDY